MVRPSPRPPEGLPRTRRHLFAAGRLAACPQALCHSDVRKPKATAQNLGPNLLIDRSGVLQVADGHDDGEAYALLRIDRAGAREAFQSQPPLARLAAAQRHTLLVSFDRSPLETAFQKVTLCVFEMS